MEISQVTDEMVNPSCPKTSADPMLGVHNGACGYVCLIIAAIACHTAISIICHRKKVKPCKMRNWTENELIELINSNHFRLSIPIQNLSIQFQFNSCWIELNWLSIPIQFMNWSELWIIMIIIIVIVIILSSSSSSYHFIINIIMPLPLASITTIITALLSRDRRWSA